MQDSRQLLVYVIFAMLLAISGCGPNPNQGFTVVTKEVVTPPPGLQGIAFPLVETPVEGQYVPSGAYSPGGSVASYDADTNSNGQFYLSNAMAPALWNHEVWLPSFCLYPASPVYFKGTSIFSGLNEFEEDDVPMDNLGAFEWDCITLPSQIPQASSRFAIAGSLPSSVTLHGLNPFTTQYGLPMMYVFNGTSGAPNLYTTITASSVDPSGLSATFPLPSSLPQNGYAFETANETSAGIVPNSFNLYSIASSQTIAGNPFGVSVSGQTDVTLNCIWFPGNPYGGHYQCTSTSAYNPVPVVSLYSAGQVLIGGTPVNVGANPTAVAAYTSSPVSTTTYNGNNYTTLTVNNSTRAAVTNSGANTISILDTVNKALVSTITVGNQPVALVTTSSGGTAYVANYTDSTVTEVNLSSDAATTTVAVGGHPTSVALTAAGILWVGGSGFLTEINTSNMSVVGTESVSGKTIVSLGYSDAYSKLAVSSVDTSGNVYVEEVTPSTFQPGGAYAPVASQVVSAVGTYLNPGTNTNVLGYTATLAKAAPIKINAFQPGAPPLVVQDGWAVITATPTGFTITDVSGNVVLVSQTTPSPITAIAVDANLHIAYLTMPDSNIVLTVPLPGTN